MGAPVLERMAQRGQPDADGCNTEELANMCGDPPGIRRVFSERR